MDIGMLWFDNNPKSSLETKIKRAAYFYEKKYGRKPNLCFVHPTMLKTPGEQTIAGLKTRPSRSVLPNHFWIGIEKESKK
jgi:hypothetical protein